MRLAELCVWNTALPDNVVSLLSAYTQSRWGLVVPQSVPDVLPPITPVGPIPLFVWTADAASTMLGTNGQPVAGAGAAIRSWIPQAGPVSAATTFTRSVLSGGEATLSIDASGRPGVYFPGDYTGTRVTFVLNGGSATDIRGRAAFVAVRYKKGVDGVGTYVLTMGDGFHLKLGPGNIVVIRPNVSDTIGQSWENPTVDELYIVCVQYSNNVIKVAMMGSTLWSRSWSDNILPQGKLHLSGVEWDGATSLGYTAKFIIHEVRLYDAFAQRTISRLVNARPHPCRCSPQLFPAVTSDTQLLAVREEMRARWQ